MAAPKSISPSGGSQELEPIQEIQLSFADRLNVDELSAMLRFEVRPTPGLEATGDGKVPSSVQLTDRDFTVKEIERTSIRDAVQYQITFDAPIPYGRVVTMTLQLSLDERLKGVLVRHTFATQTPFRLAGIGCGRVVFPLLPRVVCIRWSSRSKVEVAMNHFSSNSATNWDPFHGGSKAAGAI